MGPFDYSVNMGNPLGAFTQSFGQGLQLRQVQAQQTQAQAQMQQQAQLRQAMAELGQARTPSAKIAVFDKYPTLAAPLAEAGGKLDGAIKSAIGQAGLQAYALLEAGDAGGAARIMAETSEAMRNSNRPELAQQIDVISKGLETSPEFGRNALSSWLAVNAREDFEGYGKAMEARGKGEAAITGAAAAAEQRPLETRAKAAAATTAEAKAAIAAPMAALELEKSGWDIKALQNDMQIKRQNAQIAAMNAAIDREGNALKRQELELKVAELNDKVGTRIRERAAEGRAAQAQADVLLETADRALKAAAIVDPATGKITGFSDTVRNATGTIDSRLPTIRSDVADFEALIETMGSQVTMSRIGEMKGVLSDRDLEVLRQSMASLSLRQSPAALVSNLQNIVRLTNKAKEVTADKFGLPVGGEAAPQPAPAATGGFRVVGRRPG
jgi:hypothetical protein